ncbi:MAG: glycosyltransferase family 2 protein [Bacteroidales bacterium]|nr:glycosyltransferase family 2 protein [Bacteroidales bacterium]
MAPYIERCARALMGQTLWDVEFIFVDDASPDNSVEVLEKVLKAYPGRRVKLLRHDRNRGLPAARNTGLAAATGEYIWHCDSDDWPEPEMLEKLYNAAKRVDADIAYCDFYLDYGSRKRYMENPEYTAAKDMLEQGFLGGRMKYNVWNKIIRRSLYRNVTFPEGHSMGEDMTVITLATRATRVVHVPQALYHYFKLNDNAFSNTFSTKHLEDIRYNVERIWSALDGVPELNKMFFRLNIKLPFLFSGKYSQYLLWKEWFPESNPYIEKNSFLPERTRRVQVWARKGYWPLVWLYAFAVNRIYYGLLIRNR